jgi:hypothetical protein
MLSGLYAVFVTSGPQPSKGDLEVDASFTAQSRGSQQRFAPFGGITILFPVFGSRIPTVLIRRFSLSNIDCPIGIRATGGRHAFAIGRLSLVRFAG